MSAPASPTQIFGEDARERTRQRHARESSALVGQIMFPGNPPSREGVRQAGIVRKRAPELEQLVMSGEMTMNAAYLQATGEDRVPLYVKLDPEVDDELRRLGAQSGISRQQLVIAIVTSWLFGERDAS